MKRSKRLSRVAELQKMKERQQARALGLVQQQLQQEMKNYQQIQNYEKEYRSVIQLKAEERIAGGDFSKYVMFINQLGVVILMQQGRIEQLEGKVELFQKAWWLAYQKLKAYERVCGQAKKLETAEEEKKEQKENDSQIRKRWTSLE